MNKKRLFCLLLISVMLLGSINVNAIKYSKKTKVLTSQVKVKRAKGSKMKSADVDKLTAASLNLLNSTIQGDKEGANVLISPSSIMFAFGLAETRGEKPVDSLVADVHGRAVRRREDHCATPHP